MLINFIIFNNFYLGQAAIAVDIHQSTKRQRKQSRNTENVHVPDLQVEVVGQEVWIGDQLKDPGVETKYQEVATKDQEVEIEDLKAERGDQEVATEYQEVETKDQEVAIEYQAEIDIESRDHAAETDTAVEGQGQIREVGHTGQGRDQEKEAEDQEVMIKGHGQGIMFRFLIFSYFSSKS